MNSLDEAEQEKLKASVEVVSKSWIASSYYDEAARWTFMFWGDNHRFRRFFERKSHKANGNHYV